MIGKAFLSLFSSDIQRYPVGEGRPSKLRALVRRGARWVFRRQFHKASDTRPLTAAYWGGEGGFRHALNQFERPNNEWQRDYAPFFEECNRFITAGQSVLEIGCSAGQWCKRLNLLSRGCTYLGVDVNAQTIAFACESFAGEPGARFLAGDISDYPELGQFDLVLCCQVLCFLNLSNVERVIGCVRPGGTIVIEEPANVDCQDRPARVPQPLKSHRAGVPAFSYNFSALLETHGFEIVTARHLDFGERGFKMLVSGRRRSD